MGEIYLRRKFFKGRYLMQYKGLSCLYLTFNSWKVKVWEQGLFLFAWKQVIIF